MPEASNVSEYWFYNYYRVLVIELDKEYVVEVDVYRKDWPFKDVDKIECLSNKKYCMLYKSISPEYIMSNNLLSDEVLVKSLNKVIIVGVKVGERSEVINVRYFINKDIMLRYDYLESLFYSSWRIIGCKPPLIENTF